MSAGMKNNIETFTDARGFVYQSQFCFSGKREGRARAHVGPCSAYLLVAVMTILLKRAILIMIITQSVHLRCEDVKLTNSSPNLS